MFTTGEPIGPAEWIIDVLSYQKVGLRNTANFRNIRKAQVISISGHIHGQV